MRKGFLLAIMCMIFLMATISSPLVISKEENQSQFENIWFGFTDRTGLRIVAVENENINPNKLTKAICEEGKVLPVLFEGFKDADTEKNNGRQNAGNFDYCGGYYFSITSGKTFEDSWCVLTEEDFLKNYNAVKVKQANYSKISPELLKKIYEKQKMKVKEGWVLAGFGNSNKIGTVLFEDKKNNSLLKCTVLVYNNRLYFSDFGEGVTLYAKDDYIDILGMSIPQCEEVFNIFTKGNSVFVLMQRYLDEGKNISLIQASGEKLKYIKGVSRYTYPE